MRVGGSSWRRPGYWGHCGHLAAVLVEEVAYGDSLGRASGDQGSGLTLWDDLDLQAPAPSSVE